MTEIINGEVRNRGESSILSVFANYGGNITALLAPVIALPFYLNMLGPGEWGKVNLVVALVAAFGVFEAGLAQAVSPEVARLFQPSAIRSLREFVYTYEKMYWIMALVLALCAVCVGSFVLQQGENGSSTRPFFYAAGMLLLFQVPGSFYRVVLLNSGQHVLQNKIFATFAVSKQLSGLMAVWMIPRFETYLAVALFFTIAETSVRGVHAGRQAPFSRWAVFNYAEARRITKIAPLTIFAVALGAANVQIDKLFIASLCSLEQLAYYSIASTLALSTLQLIYPLTTVGLVRLAGSAHSHKSRINKKLILATIAICLLSGIAYDISGDWVLNIWLTKADVALSVKESLNWLLIGSVMNAFGSIAYINWLVEKRVGSILICNFVSLCSSAVLIPICIRAWGPTGASVGWVIHSSMWIIPMLWRSASEQDREKQ